MIMSTKDKLTDLLREADAHNIAGRHQAMRACYEAANALGSPLARHNLAICLAGGVGGPVNLGAAQDLAEQGAEAGDPESRQMLAVAIASGWKGAPDYDRALALREQHANEGDPLAVLETGLILATQTPDEAEAVERLRAAAGHDILLARAALVRWLIEHQPDSPDIARELDKLDQSKVFIAKRLREIHTAMAGRTKVAAGSEHMLVDELNARAISRAIPPIIADYAMTRSLIHLRPAQIIQPITGIVAPHPVRRCLSATLHLPYQDIVLHWLERRMAAMAGMDWSTGERVNVFGYRPGEEYRPHVDYIDPDEGPAARDSLTRDGQYLHTVLVTLHDGFSGGETVFPHFSKGWKGQTGDALVFDSASESGDGLPHSVHAGAPVTGGFKMMASLWCRQRPQVH